MNPNPTAPASDCPTHSVVPQELCPKLRPALQGLKSRLQLQLATAHPGHPEDISQAVAEAEALAWQTPFPHLFLPDFAELRLSEILAAGEPAWAHAA